MAGILHLADDDLVMVFGSYAGRGPQHLENIAQFLRDHGIKAYTVEGYFDTFKPQPRRDSLVDSRFCVDICDAAIFVFFMGTTIGIDEGADDAEPKLISMDQGPLVELTHLDESDRRIPVQTIFDTPERRIIMSTLVQNILHGWLLGSYVDQQVIEEDTEAGVIEGMKLAARGFCWSILLRP